MNFTPENQLEIALVQASADASAIPLFYQLLLESPLFALTPPNSRPHGEGALQKGDNISIVNWADGDRRIVPIFSSLPLLRKAVEGSPVACDYISLRGRELLGILAKGDAPAMLNPTFAYGKELDLDEMRELATGKLPEDENAPASPLN